MQLTHVRILVDDFDKCLSFYRDALGLKLEVEAHGIYAEFSTGGTRLGLYRKELMAAVVGDAEEEISDSDRVVCIFSVVDVDATYEQLRSRGVNFVNSPHDQEAWVLRVAHFRDPEGNLCEIYQPLT